MKVLIACEESQAVCKEFRRLGHEAYSCDLQECSGGHPEWHIVGDCISKIGGGCEFSTMDGTKHTIAGKWDLLIAHPPCTELCNSGQRWYTEQRKPLTKQREAIAFFYKFVMADCEHIAIENPIGIMSTAYRKADQVINPYQFGDPECKNTCLWLKNLPALKPTNIVPKELRKRSIWLANFDGKQYSWNDPIVAKLRSKTFPGIAMAMAEQWSQFIESGLTVEQYEQGIEQTTIYDFMKGCV